MQSGVKDVQSGSFQSLSPFSPAVTLLKNASNILSSIYTQCLERQGKKWILKRCVILNVLKREKTKVLLWHLTYSRLDDRCRQSAQVQGAGCRVHSDGSWSPEVPGHPGMTRWSQSRRFKLPITQDNRVFLPSASLIDLVIGRIIIFWVFWHR